MAQTPADRETPAHEPAVHEPPLWVVELNIAGYRIRRRAAKRRHLLRVPARPSSAA